MGAATCDLSIEQGSDFSVDVVYNNDAGTPYNLTGYTARMYIRAQTDWDTILAELTTANTKLVITGASGKVSMRVTGAETAIYYFVSGFYDLEIISPTGAVTRLLEGKITVDREVTY